MTLLPFPLEVQVLPPFFQDDDLNSSPFAQQLAVGFKNLRFTAALEQQYREHSNGEGFDYRRYGACLGIVLWALFSIFDILSISPAMMGWVLGVRLGGLCLLILMCWTAFQRPFTHQFPLLSVSTLLTLGAVLSVFSGVVQSVEQSDPSAYLLLCLAAYFLAGLRLPQALSCCVLLILFYLISELVVTQSTPAAQAKNLLFLLTGNLLGAVGAYLIEYKSRQAYLLKQLVELSSGYDRLTGLPNQRSFQRQFETLYRLAQRQRCSIALLLCDLDCFSAYNSQHDSVLGDKALQVVAGLLQQGARRPLDFVARLEGARFAMVLYDIDCKEARNHAQALRITLQGMGIEHLTSEVADVLTMSVGVACSKPDEQADGLTKLSEYADRALYEAKAFGRNQVGF